MEELQAAPVEESSGPVDRDLGLPAYQAARAGLGGDAMTGGTLLHADLHGSNPLGSDHGVWLIDWGIAGQGAAWVEPALFIPRPILVGHPLDAEPPVAGQAGGETVRGGPP